jgi:adenylosuccinate synthase
MPVEAIVGANWGDEGKGKMTDFLAGQADFVVRFQGGRNAGHTVINEYGKFALHLLPSGVFHSGVVNILGPGVALDVPALLSELATLADRQVPQPTVRVSDRAQVVLPFHAILDQCEEKRLGAAQFGSTQCGIAPFYGDKHLKVGIQVADLHDRDRLVERLEMSLVGKNVLFERLYGKRKLLARELLPDIEAWADQLQPYVCDTTELLHNAMADGKRILLEGQLGALRDPDHGIYPFSSSSSPLAGFASVGAGVPPHAITRVIAVVKAYSTCVGAGPFVTELTGKTAATLRDRGGDNGEYGATTGRPRRVGWFDAVATRYGCRVQGATEVALSMLDVLGYLKEIPVCVAYEIGGIRSQRFPPTAQLLDAKPVLETLPGWGCDVSGVRDSRDLPEEALAYVRRIEELIGVPVGWISVGSHRDATFRMR